MDRIIIERLPDDVEGGCPRRTARFQKKLGRRAAGAGRDEFTMNPERSTAQHQTFWLQRLVSRHGLLVGLNATSK
jgi:hypothetical protein